MIQQSGFARILQSKYQYPEIASAEKFRKQSRKERAHIYIKLLHNYALQLPLVFLNTKIFSAFNYTMNTIKEILSNAGLDSIEVHENHIKALKENEELTCKIVNETVDITDTYDYLLIPYDQDFLLYKVKDWAPSNIKI